VLGLAKEDECDQGHSEYVTLRALHVTHKDVCAAPPWSLLALMPPGGWLSPSDTNVAELSMSTCPFTLPCMKSTPCEQQFRLNFRFAVTCKHKGG
jgi:hypothetical protein